MLSSAGLIGAAVTQLAETKGVRCYDFPFLCHSKADPS